MLFDEINDTAITFEDDAPVIFEDYVDASHGKTTFRELFEKYDITHALVKKESIEAVYMEEDGLCNKLYEDEYFVIYRKCDDELFYLCVI